MIRTTFPTFNPKRERAPLDAILVACRRRRGTDVFHVYALSRDIDMSAVRSAIDEVFGRTVANEVLHRGCVMSYHRAVDLARALRPLGVGMVGSECGRVSRVINALDRS